MEESFSEKQYLLASYACVVAHDGWTVFSYSAPWPRSIFHPPSPPVPTQTARAPSDGSLKKNAFSQLSKIFKKP